MNNFFEPSEESAVYPLPHTDLEDGHDLDCWTLGCSIEPRFELQSPDYDGATPPRHNWTILVCAACTVVVCEWWNLMRFFLLQVLHHW